MTIVKLKLQDNNLDRLVNSLIEVLDFAYENHCPDMSVLAPEQFYLRNMSTQMNLIVLKREASSILIDVMGAAGGSGMLNLDLGSEDSFARRATKKVHNYASAHNLAVEMRSKE